MGVCVHKPLNNSILCWGAKLKHVLERQDLPSSTSWKASAKDSKKKQKSKEKQWDKDRISAVKLASVIDKRAKRLNWTYLCRQTPSSAPRPRCAPSSAAGPCTECKDPDGGAVATTLTARLRDSHTAGCWSAGGWGREETDGWGGVKDEETDRRNQRRHEENSVTWYSYKEPLTRSWAWACGWNWPRTAGWCCCCWGCWGGGTANRTLTH